MSMINAQELSQLFDRQDPPCVSIYQPTRRTFPERQRDPLEFRSLVDRAEATLSQKYPAETVKPLVEKLRNLASDTDFWEQGRDGLAVLASPSEFHTYELRAPVPALAVVADTFHVKPLLRTVQSADRFQVLCLQRDKVRLYEGNRDGLSEMEPAGVPLTVTDALGEVVYVHRRGSGDEGVRGGKKDPVARGPDGEVGNTSKGNDAKLDAKQFFRVVDQTVWEHVSRPSGAPLLLAGLPQDQTRFREVSENPHLLDGGIETSPAALSDEQLSAEAWKCFEPLYLERLQGFVDSFQAGKVRNLASDDLEQVRQAADQGRVNVLMIVADEVNQTAITDPTQSAAGDDPLDDLAELVIRQKGTVVVVPQERMPTTTGLAATYRY